MSFVDFQELKERVEISAACSFLRIDLKNNGAQWRGKCPACQSSTARSLVVTPDKKAAYCFTAKKGGDVIWLASHILGVSQKEAALQLNEAFGMGVGEVKPKQSRSDSTPVRGLMPLTYLQADHENVVGLGLRVDVAEYFECGHAPKGIMRGKLAIPIHDGEGALLAYCGYDYEDGSLSFPNGFEAENFLFNAHRIEEGDLYLTTDPLQVLLAYQNGVENVVSVLAASIGPKQLRLVADLMTAKNCSSVEIIA